MARSDWDFAMDYLNQPNKWIATANDARWVSRWSDAQEFECADNEKGIMFITREIEKAVRFFCDGSIPQGITVEHMDFVYG